MGTVFSDMKRHRNFEMNVKLCASVLIPKPVANFLVNSFLNHHRHPQSHQFSLIGRLTPVVTIRIGLFGYLASFDCVKTFSLDIAVHRV